MAEKTLKTRIQQKHDKAANWELATNFVPKQGELIVYDIDENYSYERVKIGDGSTNVNALPFATDECVIADLNDADAGIVPKTNSDQLGGLDAEDYATKDFVSTELANIGLQPQLVGTSEEIGPMEAYQALLQGRSIKITHPSNSFGTITFTKFTLVSNGDEDNESTVLIANGSLGNYQFQLVGLINSDDWHLYEEEQLTRYEDYLSLGNFVENNYYKKYDTYNKTEVDALITNAGGTQGNWDQNDSSAEDYIQNRTHWKEEAEVEQTYSFYDNDTVTIYGYDDYSPTWGGMGSDGYYYRGNYTEFENRFPADFHPREGQRVYVTVGDYSFSGVLNSDFEIGDPHLASWAYTYEELLETPLTADYYCSFHEIPNIDYNAIYLSLNPDLGIVGSQPLTITVVDTVNGTVYHPLEKEYIPKEAFILPAYNLLDNSDFTNPINQRGFVSGNSVSSWEYFLDRWINTSDAARVFTLTDNGMGLEADTTLCQKLEGVKSGTVLTLAACLSDGTIATVTGTVTYNSDNSWLRVASGNIDGFDLYIDTYAGLLQATVYTRSNAELKWAALYEGEYTAETLPLYVSKGYAAEMAECQRYFVAFRTAGSNGLILGTGYVANTTTARVVVPLAVPMRTKPTVTSLNSNIYAHGNGTRFDVTNLTVLADAKKQIILQFNLSTSTTASSAIMLGFSSPDNNLGYQAFSADL